MTDSARFINRNGRLWDSRLAWTALVLFAAPLLAANLSLLISVHYGNVPACFPYWDGEISVSRAGRRPPASYVFKPLVIACGVLGFLYWPVAMRRLAALAGRETLTRTEKAAATIGAMGAALSIVYAVALGDPGDFARFMRRFGAYAYFIGVTIAQLLFAFALRNVAREFGTESQESGTASRLRRRSRFIWGTVAAMLALGLLGMPTVYFIVGSKAIAERVVEWNYLIPMHLFFLASFFIWRDATRLRSRRDD